MAKPERKLDELWTSYLTRRLEEVGFTMSDYEANSNGEFSSEIHLGADKNIQRIIYLEKDTHERIAKAPSYDDISKILKDCVFINDSATNADIWFYFGMDGTTRCERSTAPPDKRFEKYEDREKGETYKAQEVIDDIVEYVKESGKSGVPKAKDRNCPKPKAESREMKEPASRDDRTLNEILQRVKRIERVAIEHPLVMKGEDAYLKEVYLEKINKDRNNLNVFEFDGRRIAYVLVDNPEIWGNGGRYHENLIFVAKDIAKQEWQQKIVAYHESLESEIGHDKAKEKEIELAKALGKEKEYRKWREETDKNHKI